MDNYVACPEPPRMHPNTTDFAQPFSHLWSRFEVIEVGIAESCDLSWLVQAATHSESSDTSRAR